ncbi:23S rRNA (guanosine2251-2'-O)-methyltransferase [Nonlabens sp. Hel1_33_55]|uniref:23S rRNA (guanosine(2251)-2'-O)-methyltransferase RlmB n=1 Tax=Nonlabens sp. Hel1_33_55 TaxID=1336802 RepID=UPI000875CAA3|nr:23S rRNA (guanosine(2251)-2'-O)-methyltransferase RlmB [Nonlabens sp. Hel1_33_55]SCY22105.1 23S rRNA (guanosine2251-2'-O)-methyltransferase [Nonlabens sp. Hel1_33_55]
MDTKQQIHGLRPILEAIESGEEISKIYFLKEGNGVLFNQLKFAAKKAGIGTSFVPEEKLYKLTKENHQGAVAVLSPISYSNLEEVLEEANLEENPQFLLLDGVTDVGNYGAIIRTAECTGVAAIIVSEKGSAPINGVVVKTSAGAVFNIPICKVNHLKDAIYLMQAYGIQTMGASEKAEKSIYQTDLNIPLALVMGSEDRGINPSTLKILDQTFSLPMLGKIASLNVSVACGAMLYEAVRQRQS